MSEQIIEPTQQPTEPTNEPEKIVTKKASKPRAKTAQLGARNERQEGSEARPKAIKKEIEQPNIKVNNELDEEQVIEFIKTNENLKKEILKILMMELINKI